MAKTRNGEGSIRTRATKGGTVYDVQLTVRNRRTGLSDRIFKGGFKTEKAAVQWRNATMQKSNIEGLVRAKPITVPEVVLAWLDSGAVKAPSTMIRYRSVYKNHIATRLNVRVASLTEDALNHFMRTTRDSLALRACTDGAGTNVIVMNMLHAAFRWASSRSVGMVEANPLDDMAHLDRPRLARREAMPIPEATRLMAAAKGKPSLLLWQMFAATGARRGEILGLNWGDVNMEAGTIKIQAIASPETGGIGRASRTKGRRERKIHLPQALLETLAEFRGGFRAGNEPLFKAPHGGRLSFTTLRYWWLRDCRKAGVSGYSPHCLRHTFATTALEQKIPVNVVSSILGHSSAAITLSVYAHETEAQKAEAVDAVAGMFARSVTS